MKRTPEILLCDLDAFFASVEQRDNPDLIGKPVIIGGRPEGRGVVATCSYEARKYGVHSAMPVKKALSLCPDAILIKGHMQRYREVSLQVQQIFEQFTPDIEIVSIDEAYLAVPPGSGSAAGAAIHRAVKQELNLPISVGVSLNKLLAKIACEIAKPNKVGTLWPDEIAEKLWPLPVRVLPGIGPVAEKSLHSRNIKTVKDLAAYPPESLARFFGSNYRVIHGYANGIDQRELECCRDAKSISEETTFPEDIYDREEINTTLMELSSGVGYRLRRAGLSGYTVTLKVRFSNFKTITRSITLPKAISCDHEIYQKVSELFLKHSDSAPWRLVGVQISGFEEGSQLSLLQATVFEQKEEQLTVVRDKLRQKYGTEVIIQAKRLKKRPPGQD